MALDSQGTSRGAVLATARAAAALASTLPPLLGAAGADADTPALLGLLRARVRLAPSLGGCRCRGFGKQGELGGARVLFVSRPIGHDDDCSLAVPVPCESGHVSACFPGGSNA